jgi:predicted helicase
MQHFLKGNNVGLVFRRQQLPVRQTYYFISKYIICDGLIRSDNKGGESVAPLYSYEDEELENKDHILTRKPNFNMSIVKEIAKGLGLKFTTEKQTNNISFAPIDLLDYIYAVLHSPGYRDKYKEFLKIDFPRVPYPKDSISFWKLVSLGKEIREFHLLESKEVNEYITDYPQDGNNIVEKLSWTTLNDHTGQVWINDKQYFDKVPLIAYEFYIGGYQPAQKWLKDRKGRILNFDDITHYQKIIVALDNTHKLMAEIDKVLYPKG